MTDELMVKLQTTNAIRLLDARIDDKKRQIRTLQDELTILVVARNKKEAELESIFRR